VRGAAGSADRPRATGQLWRNESESRAKDGQVLAIFTSPAWPHSAFRDSLVRQNLIRCRDGHWQIKRIRGHG